MSVVAPSVHGHGDSNHALSTTGYPEDLSPEEIRAIGPIEEMDGRFHFIALLPMVPEWHGFSKSYPAMNRDYFYPVMPQGKGVGARPKPVQPPPVVVPAEEHVPGFPNHPRTPTGRPHTPPKRSQTQMGSEVSSTYPPITQPTGPAGHRPTLPNKPPPAPTKSAGTLHRELEKLEQELQDAINQQSFEKCVPLRDAISKLKDQLANAPPSPVHTEAVDIAHPPPPPNKKTQTISASAAAAAIAAAAPVSETRGPTPSKGRPSDASAATVSSSSSASPAPSAASGRTPTPEPDRPMPKVDVKSELEKYVVQPKALAIPTSFLGSKHDDPKEKKPSDLPSGGIKAVSVPAAFGGGGAREDRKSISTPSDIPTAKPLALPSAFQNAPPVVPKKRDPNKRKKGAGVGIPAAFMSKPGVPMSVAPPPPRKNDNKPPPPPFNPKKHHQAAPSPAGKGAPPPLPPKKESHADGPHGDSAHGPPGAGAPPLPPKKKAPAPPGMIPSGGADAPPPPKKGGPSPSMPLPTPAAAAAAPAASPATAATSGPPVSSSNAPPPPPKKKKHE